MLRDNLSVGLAVVILLACFCSGMLHEEKGLQKRQRIRTRSSIRGTNSHAPEEDQAPLFVLHVGPPKTGTTTIQHLAKTTEDQMKKDNFYYLGTTNFPKTKNFHDLIRYCRDGKDLECKDKWEEFKSIVRDHLELGNNVFMSEEMLNICGHPEEEQEYLWDNLMPLLSEGWRVRIVFTYRHFHDWVPSRYSQANNFHITDRNRIKKENWPNDGGRIMESFVDFFDKLERRTFIFPLQVKRRWSQRFSDVQVFDMVNSTNLARDFYCQMIPEAEQLCRYLESPETVLDTMNPSSDRCPRFDMMVVEAFSRGWFDASLSRMDVVHAAEMHAPDIGYSQRSDFPMECLSAKMTEKLFQQSLAYAKEMFPEEYASRNEEQELRYSFDEMVAGGKLCSVDVDATLKDRKWQKFFEKLSGDNIRPETSS